MIMNNFDLLIKDRDLLRGIYKYNYEKPRKIQIDILSIIHEERDILFISEEDKTSSLVLSLLSLKMKHSFIITDNINTLNEIKKMIQDISYYMKTDFRISICLSELFTMNMLEDVDLLMIDNFDKLKDFHLEEINDKMKIYIFSNIFTDNLLYLSINLKNKAYLTSEKDFSLLKDIKLNYINVKDIHNKYDTIIDLYENMILENCLIYVNCDKEAIQLYDKLSKEDYPINYIIEGKEDKNKIIEDFKTHKIRYLISTIKENKIDNTKISLIINYDIPKIYDYYDKIVNSRVVINIITDKNIKDLLLIEDYYDIEVLELSNNIKELLR